MLNELEITGRARTHVLQFHEPTRFAAQQEAGEAFLAMRAAAAKDGINVVPVSSFRDFQTQLRIWNYKFSGQRPLYDIHGVARDFGSLTPEQVIDCILNWSALPGGSRHQWGTEIDVVDGAAPALYEPMLLPQEVASGGIYERLHKWLDANIAKFGFFRPYEHYQGGMYPEPWHLSYAPLSTKVIGQVSADLLTEVIEASPVLGKDLLLPRIPEIFRNHILNFNRAPSA
ncbi:M15 family metallopeptidase [Caenimonas soli]|uniref:M15 family metallopeptidase n=1 Tax=Caenimonas soli TaxID=2735555 RepID=UPI001F1C9D88|nr:M15 family metallopeptidase [Caenimonas soli]